MSKLYNRYIQRYFISLELSTHFYYFFCFTLLLFLFININKYTHCSKYDLFYLKKKKWDNNSVSVHRDFPFFFTVTENSIIGMYHRIPANKCKIIKSEKNQSRTHTEMIQVMVIWNR